MFTKLLVLILVLLLADLGYASSALAQNREAVEQAKEAQPLSKKEIKRAGKARKIIKGLGIGPDSRTEIRRTDKIQLKGYVSEATDEYFVMTDEKTGATTSIEYAQVEKIMKWPTVKTAMKRDMFSLSGIFKKVAIGTIIVVGAVAVWCGTTRRCEH